MVGLFHVFINLENQKGLVAVVMLSHNFKYYLLLPWLMSIPSRKFRIWVMKKYHVKIGKGTIICKNALFRNGFNIEIGKNCVINSKTLLDGRGGKVSIGDNVYIGRESIIWTMSHNPQTHEAIRGDVCIGNNCRIGCRVIIMPGITVGDSSICAANAVVTKEVKENAICEGIPAKNGY